MTAKGVLIAAVVGAMLAWSPASSTAEMKSKDTRGAEVYSKLCSTCHGQYGRGDGPLADNLYARLPDFTDSSWFAGRSDDQIVKSLWGANHQPMMMARVLKPDVLRDAVAYIRTLSVPGEHVSVPAGRDIYQATCWVCHGEHGDGKGPAAKNLEGPSPRDFTNPEFVIEGREDEIARTIAFGAAESFHGSAMMPSWGSSLSPQQIRDVVAYLKTFRKH